MITKTGIERAQVLDGTTQANRLAVNSAGEIVVLDHWFEVAVGRLAGHYSFAFFGRNPSISSGSGFETIWNGGGDYPGHNATGAETVQVYSTSANDASAGTGLRTVWITGLDGSYNPVSETVTLNGTTPVDTVNTYKRLSYAEGRTAGSVGANVGTIIARQKVTTANVFFNMPVGMNHTAVAVYTVPANSIGFITNWGHHILSSATATSEARLMIRKPGEIWLVEDIGSSQDTNPWKRDYKYFTHHPLSAGTDVKINANTTGTGNTIGAHLDIIVIPEGA